jgi:hypothetical protein
MKATEKKSVIKIDPHKMEVKLLHLDPAEYKSELGCDLFESIWFNPLPNTGAKGKHQLIIDESGLLRQHKAGFDLFPIPETWVGPALIAAIGDVSYSVEEIKKHVIWRGSDELPS